MKKELVDRLVRFFMDEAKEASVKKNKAIAEGYQITDKNPSSTRNFAENNPEQFNSADTAKFGPEQIDRTPEGAYPKTPVFDDDIANSTKSWDESGNRARNIRTADKEAISQTETNLPTDARVTDNIDIRAVEDGPITIGNKARGRDAVLSMDKKLDNFIDGRVNAQRIEDTIDGKLSKLTDMYVEIEASRVMNPEIKAQLLKKLTDKMLKMQNKEILSSKNANRTRKVNEQIPKERVRVDGGDYYMGNYEGEPVSGINMSVDKQLARRRKNNARYEEEGQDKYFESELDKLFDDINKQGL